jgi:hypothetical protein
MSKIDILLIALPAQFEGPANHQYMSGLTRQKCLACGYVPERVNINTTI